MKPYYEGQGVTLFHGDCIEAMREMPDASVHAIVTDPPYGLGFMGKEWDDLPPGDDFAREALRVLKPGGHMLAFGGSRTWHRLAVAVEDAGFEIRDSIAWLYGSGFPKSLNLDGEWKGWGTSLKPSFEPIVVARKSFPGTVAANVLAHGTGALHIDATRIAYASDDPTLTWGEKYGGGRQRADGGDYKTGMFGSGVGQVTGTVNTAGRWPTNVVLDESQAAALDVQSGRVRGFATQRDTAVGARESGSFLAGITVGEGMREGYNDSGGASRFFPVFTAPPSELPQVGDVIRSMGQPTTVTAVERRGENLWCVLIEHPGGREEFLVDTTRPLPTFRFESKAPRSQRPRVNGVAHPTVKPLDLMRWLCRLVTPVGGTILEPFAGSGTTIEAALIERFNVVGIEREADYLPLIMSRIEKPIDVVLDWGAP